MPLNRRLICHCTSNDSEFHLTASIKKIVHETGKRPVIELIEVGLKENGRDIEEYWIQQFASWGFELLNRRHYTVKNFISPKNKDRYFHLRIKYTPEEKRLIELLNTYGDCTTLQKSISVSRERIRQYLNSDGAPTHVHPIIIDFYKKKASMIIHDYNKLIA